MSGKGFIAVEPPDVCADCGGYHELRPYRPADGARICYDCARNYPVDEINKRMAEHLGLPFGR